MQTIMITTTTINTTTIITISNAFISGILKT